MAGFDRSRVNLGRRTQEQTDNRESNGATRKSFMNYSKCGLKFFKFTDVGKYQDINILPWRISSKNHPGVVDGKYEIGDYDYVLDLWVHSRIGPGEEDCVCLKRTYGKPCPICDEGDRLWANPETKESARQFFAKRKCIYLVDELNDKFESVSNEPKIFEVTHGLFSKDLQSKATSCLRGKGVVDFASVNVDSKGREIGKVVSFTVGEGTMGNGRKFKKAENFEFNERVQEVSDEMLEKCPSLDSMLVVKTPEEMKAMLYGEPDSEDNRSEEDDYNNDTPARFNNDNDDDTPERGERNRREERSRREEPPMDDERNSPRDEHPAREERSRREEPEDNYQSARTSSRRGTAADEPTMPFDDPTDTGREAPAEPKREAGKCPFGHIFGKDCEKGTNCGKCPDNVYAKCSAAHQSSRG